LTSVTPPLRCRMAVRACVPGIVLLSLVGSIACTGSAPSGASGSRSKPSPGTDAGTTSKPGEQSLGAKKQEGQALGPSPTASAYKFPQPLSTATATQIPIGGSVEPSCVSPGGVASISVRTRPQASVVYDTHYAGGKTGGKPPFGDGLGGNNGGMASEGGDYTDSWVISPQAPLGPARAWVIVGSRGQKNQKYLPFTVAAAGSC
jgi:hypothetical protein